MIEKAGWRKRNLWLLIICVIISFIVSAVYFRTLQDQTIENIERTSNVYAERTESIINSVFHKTDVLAAVVSLQNGNITENTFQRIATIVYKENSGIRGIQYMPGAIVTYSYPVEGNEAVIGKNFLEIPERKKDVLLAIDTKSIALSGPYHLIQGGLGVVARNPIFLTDSSGKEYFWGFSAIILDLPDALESAGLVNLREDGYDYQLYCINENNERLVIEGNPNLDTTNAVCGEIKVPHHVWTLAVSELNPWMNMAKAGIMLLVGLLLSLILWLLYCLMLQKEATIIAKDRFFSDISHDMRTPLNAIMGFSNLARRKGLSNEDKDTYLAKIQASGKLLLDLVNDTLTVSRANSGKLVLRTAPVATEDLIHSIIEPIRIIAQEKNITLDLNTAAYRPRIIVADRLNVQKIMLNVLTNAVKYTPCGGHIWVTVADESAEGKQSWLVFTVRDDGIGMAPEFLEHIYEPFAQEQREGYEGMGTGLGLAIVNHLVNLMQGIIAIDSKINKGTTFTVRLHFEEAPVNPQPDKIDTSPLDGEWMRGKRVLLCEDNRLNSEIVTEYLGLYGIAVDCAENGKVGVARFSESTTDTYCAILMDIRMPVMDGFEATKLIRSLDRTDASTIPIIAVTADVLNDNIQDCLKTGMNGYISKPVDPQIMIEVLSKHIH